MKTKTRLIHRLTRTAAIVAAAVVTSLTASGQTLVLTGTTYLQDFNSIESGLPDGWTVRTGASGTALGTINSWQLVNSSPLSNAWATTSGRFANHASTISNPGTNFIGTETGAIQAAATNRSLGLRQTGAVGDPGGAFVLRLQDTVGFGQFVLALDFLNLRPETRQTVWRVDYAVGTTPTSFIPVGYYTNLSIANGGVFSKTNITFAFGSVLDDQVENVWIRIATLEATSGSGNRPTFGIDNFNLEWISVPSIPKPPIVVSQPLSRTNLQYSTATFTVGIAGTAPFTYQWKRDGTDLFNGPTGNGSTILGADSATLTILSVSTNDAGSYTVGVTNAVAPGTNGGPAILTVTPVIPLATNVAYLRTLVDPVNYLATNSTLVYTVTGTVTTFTNLTTGNTSSYYLQDSTAGINIFVTLGSTFRPAQGDVLAFTGFLSSFNSTLELVVDPTLSPASGVTVLSNNIASLPAPRIIPFSITNSLALVETQIEGAIVMLTNVYFGTNAGLTVSTTNNSTILVTNQAGETFNLFFSSQNLDTAGKVLPAFASTVIGPLTQNLGNAATPRNAGFSVTVTRFSDIVTNLPVTVQHAGNTSTLTWPAAPVTYTYGVAAATAVTGPYTPLTNSLRFLDSAGSFIDPSAGADQKFYKITTP
jgi:hypothetical protein